MDPWSSAVIEAFEASQAEASFLGMSGAGWTLAGFVAYLNIAQAIDPFYFEAVPTAGNFGTGPARPSAGAWSFGPWQWGFESDRTATALQSGASALACSSAPGTEAPFGSPQLASGDANQVVEALKIAERSFQANPPQHIPRRRKKRRRIPNSRR